MLRLVTMRRIWYALLTGVLLPAGYLTTSFVQVGRELRFFVSSAVAAGAAYLVINALPQFWSHADVLLARLLFAGHSAGARPIPLSAMQAKAIAGDTDGAVAIAHELLAQHGLAPDLCDAVLSLYRQDERLLERSVALLQRMRTERPEQFELKATQLLADIFLRDSHRQARAYVELRRLVDRFPTSPEARGAQRYLSALKQDGSRAASAIT